MYFNWNKSTVFLTPHEVALIGLDANKYPKIDFESGNPPERKTFLDLRKTPSEILNLAADAYIRAVVELEEIRSNAGAAPGWDRPLTPAEIKEHFEDPRQQKLLLVDRLTSIVFDQGFRTFLESL